MPAFLFSLLLLGLALLLGKLGLWLSLVVCFALSLGSSPALYDLWLLAFNIIAVQKNKKINNG